MRKKSIGWLRETHLSALGIAELFFCARLKGTLFGSRAAVIEEATEPSTVPARELPGQSR
ncbi:MAG: hypothetical protein V3V08_17040 [Nannocystaceae bacterium]